ncbi:lipoate--protein ligase [Actinobacillus succinogenes]|uniref:lipoate--protein ligase n=1 Tax=Actinobacillus succinogenes (strain ATCC 55618 / DSM 22257 / CCUG 43843 / 130Z) TaxID=339671 RepID=A6VLT2_ACTSZ|nr:lipoate--protein ligase [Actinobacillus succinogenes]ABR73929.1 lipoyltransferase and lipoate-protein ligase [Actinobacillus succinogenes 130Z]PHI39623.1 lipoate--protein ligase [Actinobacillus succinogenes]
MYFVSANNEITDASLNIALETYLVENRLVDEPILLFYINAPSIIIGRHQNTVAEVNQPYLEQKHIQVVRRMSGGGAVYHDSGNLNFCFIQDNQGGIGDFAGFTKPIIQALHQLGATGAELKGRNDLLIDGKKFSGNAMYVKGRRMTAHGTILFDSDLEEVTRALKPRKEKIQSHGIQSIRKRITNIKPYLAAEYQALNTFEFRDRLLLQIFGVAKREDVKEYVLTDEEWQKVYKLREERFANWDWNYGKSPEFTLEYAHKFPAGLVEYKLNVEQGHIKAIRIYGDFFGMGEMAELEQALTGVKYEKNAVLAIFERMNVKHYFGDIAADALAELLVNGVYEG